MPSISPVSDLRNYNEVLQNVSDGSPVFLTKNGRGSYAILTMDQFDAMSATIKLYSELNKGYESARKEGWIAAEDVEKKLGL